MSKKTIDKVKETILKNQMITNLDKIVCAVSGGPDSIVMLDVLNKLMLDEKLGMKYEIVVAHINHLMREEAGSEAKYVEEFCKERNITFFVKEINVLEYAKLNKLGTEEAGRKVRYEFLNEVMEKESANKIAVAHNKNDKAETILLNLFRGTGINGLKGIEATRKHYIRPILELSREEIENYAQENKLKPMIDKTNELDIYARNKVRNTVLPYVKKEFNPNILNTLDRLSSIVTKQEEYISKEVQKVYLDLKKTEGAKEISVDLKQFNELDDFIKSRIILVCIEKIKGDTMNIEMVNVEDIIKMCDKNVGNKYLIPTKNIKVSVQKGKILFINEIN